MSEIGETDTTLTDEELIDRASLYYGVKMIGGTPANHQTSKYEMRSEVLTNLGGSVEEKYLTWYVGTMTVQELVLAACQAYLSTVKCKFIYPDLTINSNLILIQFQYLHL